MSRILRLLFVGLLLIALALLLASLREYRFEVRVGPSGEAASWPFLAVERFLRRMGREVMRIERPEELEGHPRPDELLIVLEDGPALAPPRGTRLLERVRAGGRLLIAPPRLPADRLAHVRLPLFDALGVRPAALEDCRDRRRAVPLAQARDDPPRIRFDLCRTLQPPPPEGHDTLEAPLNRLRDLRPLPGTALARSERGVHLLRIPLGRGEVLLASDLDWLRSTRAGEAGHARALWRITGTSGRILLAARQQGRPLHELALRHLPETLATALLLLAAWLWARAVRLGPLQRLRHDQRRSLLEHLEAAGNHLWQHGEQAALAVALRRRLLETLARRHPITRGLDEEARLRFLAEHTGRDPDRLRAWLLDPPPRQRTEFLDLIRNLKTLEEQIRT